MFFPTIIMAILALSLVAVGYFQGENRHWTGLSIGLKMIIELLPLLIFAFITAGMVQTLITPQVLGKWVGGESGWRGIIIGSIAGGLCPGGPFVSLPLAAGLIKSGTAVSTMVAFVTSWSLWAVIRLPMEIGIMGWEFTLTRIACTFFVPPLAGFLAYKFF